MSSNNYDAKEIAGLIVIIGVFILMFSAAFGIADDILTEFRFQALLGLSGALLVGGGVWEWLSNVSIDLSGDSND